MFDINKLIKDATLSKDKVALNAYKNLKTEEQKFLTAKNAPKELTSETQLSIFNKYAKSLEDAIRQFSEADRQDLVSEYTSELEVVKKLLPKPVNESEIYSFIESDKIFFDKFQTIVEDYSTSKEQISYLELHIPKKEMGNAIKYLKSKFPTADGKMISEIVKKYTI